MKVQIYIAHLLCKGPPLCGDHAEVSATWGFKPIACAGGDLEELGGDYNPSLPTGLLPPHSSLSSTPPAAAGGDTAFLLADDDPEGFRND